MDGERITADNSIETYGFSGYYMDCSLYRPCGGA